MPTPPRYTFLSHAGRILNSGQARALLLTGNLHDLFHVDDGGRAATHELPEGEPRKPPGSYVPLVDFLRHHWHLPGKVLLVYELNGPIRFTADGDRERLKEAWLRWRTGRDTDQLAVDRMLGGQKFDREVDRLTGAFDENLQKAIGNPTVAFELLRQLCLCSRFVVEGRQALEEDLIVLVEAADLALPEGQIPSLSDADRRRLAICQDWFSDPGFLEARDSVVLLAESRSLIHHRVSRLPQVLDVEIPSPDAGARRHFLDWFEQRHGTEVPMWGTADELAELTAGLSIHALDQLLKGAAHGDTTLERDHVVAKVEDFVQSQLGDDVIEFKKPAHDLDDVVGFVGLKDFLRRELIPRFQTSGPAALPGAAVAGPIGSGKTFVFEAVASELDMVVLVLKNLRSQWFGQTDVIFERLKRVLEALSKVVIFVDEADTQFGGVGPNAHSTERRLTGKIQQMMSDPKLRGRVFWLLMTARIHLLSPDIRRPGRVGDLILPVLDPEGEDRRSFLRWVAGSVLDEPSDEQIDRLDAVTPGYSAAAFAALRSQVKARRALADEPLDFDAVLDVVRDLLPADIGATRRYQTLQALMNCTRRSLLPAPDVTDAERAAWAAELRDLEARGVG
ncbi:MAG: ATP-binding protein [Acidobacteriota bacterium]